MDDDESHVMILSYAKEWVNGKEVVFYNIDLKMGSAEWKVSRRYKDFEKLHEELKKNNGRIPDLPSKSILPLNKQEDIEQRRLGLEKYLQYLLPRLDIYSNPSFHEFTDLEENAEQKITAGINMHGRIPHLLLGFRDVHIGENRAYFFAATADSNTTSRFDAFFSNVSLPWEKKVLSNEGATWAVGSIEFYVKQSMKREEYVYEQQWIQKFKSQMFCIDFYEQMRMLMAGSDEGEIFILQMAEDNPGKYSYYFSGKVHSSRVMKVIFDRDEKKLYSVSKDKHFKVFDIMSKEVVHYISLYCKPLTDMAVDFEASKAYISDEGGSIAVIQIHTNPPKFSHWMKTPSQKTIRGIELDINRKRLFCADYDESKVYVFDIGKEAMEEKKSVILHWFHTGPNPRCLKWWEERSELLIGHRGGIFTIYNENIDHFGCVFSAQVHFDNINCIKILKDEGLVVTGSNDRSLKVGYVLYSSGPYLINGEKIW